MNGSPRTAPPVRESDCDFLLRILSDHRAHSLNEILRRSMLERGCGITVHSRAANLRDPKHGGHDIRNTKTGVRGDGSWYRLIDPAAPLEQPSPLSPPPGTETPAKGTTGATAARAATGDLSAEPPAERGDSPDAARQLSLPVAA